MLLRLLMSDKYTGATVRMIFEGVPTIKMTNSEIARSITPSRDPNLATSAASPLAPTFRPPARAFLRIRCLARAAPPRCRAPPAELHPRRRSAAASPLLLPAARPRPRSTTHVFGWCPFSPTRTQFGFLGLHHRWRKPTRFGYPLDPFSFPRHGFRFLGRTHHLRAGAGVGAG